MYTLEHKIMIAKALRKSFNDAQQDILKSTYMSNDWLLKRLREAQEEHRLFRKLADEIKEENEDEYLKQLVGI
jgi:bifunctional DNA-binding transcriptional regulator/antitoxin component of YhaV-PrlF toxin-antitoxin module